MSYSEPPGRWGNHRTAYSGIQSRLMSRFVPDLYQRKGVNKMTDIKNEMPAAKTGQAKKQTIDDILDGVSYELEKMKGLLRLAWVGCMNMNDGCNYCFDPSNGDMENYYELHSVMTVIDECVHKLDSIDAMIERATRMSYDFRAAGDGKNAAKES